VHIPFVDELNGANSGRSTYDRLSPEVGGSYRIAEDVKAFVAYRGGFRAPAALELACASATAPCSLPSALGADPPLKPVSSRDYEAGLDFDFGRSTSLEANGFWTDVDNDIQFASPNLTQVFFVNVPRTRHAGVELSGQAGLPQGLRLFGSYSYMLATYESTIQIATADSSPRPAVAGSLFPLSPVHRVRTGVGVTRIVQGLVVDADVSVRGFSGQYLRGDESNQRREIPGYAVFDLGARLAYRQFSLRIDCDNMLNRRYSSFGIEAREALGPYGSSGPPPANPPVVPFVTPGFPARLSIGLGVRL